MEGAICAEWQIAPGGRGAVSGEAICNFQALQMISRQFSLLSFRHPCKKLSSHGCLNSPTGEVFRVFSVISWLCLMKCAVQNLVRTAYTSLIDTRCYWAF